MKSNWLRGLVLGVSMALLLTGGVALAQVISIRTVPEGCLECTAGKVPNWLALYSSGWQNNETVSYHLWYEGKYEGDCPGCGQATNGDFVDEEWFLIPCVMPEIPDIPDIPDIPVLGPEEEAILSALNGGESVLGTYRIGLEGDTSGREGFLTIEVAEVCEVEEEFVPEPGTIALLGSGLVGLAGYATLRWRSRG